MSQSKVFSKSVSGVFLLESRKRAVFLCFPILRLHHEPLLFVYLMLVVSS